MYFIVYLTLLFSVLVAFFSYQFIKEGKPRSSSVCLAILISAVLSLASIMPLELVNVLIAEKEERSIEIGQEQLVALSGYEGWSVKGRLFMLGSGDVQGGSEFIYRYAVQTNLGKEIRTTESSSRIVIDDTLLPGEQPMLQILEVQERTEREGALKYFLPDKVWGVKGRIYRFSIPPGSFETTMSVKM